MSKNGRQWTKTGQNSPEFTNQYTKRQKAAKAAKKARKRNRSK